MKNLLMFLLAFALIAAMPACTDSGETGTSGGGGGPITYTVTVIGGTADPAEAEEGDEVTLTPDEPDGNQQFDGWVVESGDVEIVDNKFTMPAEDVEIRAAFEQLYTVTVTGGTASVDVAASGEEVTLTPDEPGVNERFVGWVSINGDVEIVDNKFTMPAGNVEIEAIFEQLYTVTVTGGTADPSEAAEGEEVTLTAVAPGESYEFVEWMVLGGDVDIVDNKFDMPAGDVEVEAVFVFNGFLKITDPLFLEYCQQFDADGDGILSQSECEAVTEINIANEYTYQGPKTGSLAGIEQFTALTRIDCRYNNISALNVSNNPALVYLHCGGNNLMSLGVSNNTALTSLYCFLNNISSLDLEHNTELQILFCYDNNLSALDLSNNPALTRVYCYNNNITSMDVSNNPALINFDHDPEVTVTGWPR